MTKTKFTLDEFWPDTSEDNIHYKTNISKEQAKDIITYKNSDVVKEEFLIGGTNWSLNIQKAFGRPLRRTKCGMWSFCYKDGDKIVEQCTGCGAYRKINNL